MNMNVNHDVIQKRRFDPAVKAIQFRAWQIAQRENGNVTREQIAEEMGLSTRRLARVLRGEKWAGVLRSTARDLLTRPAHEAGFAREAEDLAVRIGAVLAVDLDR
ncbi:hypothetical protein [Paracoccus sp. (in: a-proteobacteria)]|uniref:hypothetical protein n=1 Tax=Paracoccus sp. TaxID=267 RepID=UPI0028A9F876|nr:hypothetical protein [Paracoccus sp. (in: a-proteobacteria)]